MKAKKEVWFEDIFKGKIWLWFYFLGVWHSVPIKTCLGKWRAYFLWGDQEMKKKWRRKMLYRFCKHENLYSLPVHVLSDAHWAVSQQTPFPQNLQMKKWWKSEKIWLRPPLCPGAPRTWPQLDDCHSPPVQSAVDSPGRLFCREVWSIESYFWQRNLSTDVHVGSDDRSYLWHQLGKLTVDGNFIGLMVQHLKCRFARIVSNPIEKQIVFLCLLKLIPCWY